MNVFRFIGSEYGWKNNFRFLLFAGIGLILFALLIMFHPVILVVLFSALLVYIGSFFIGAAFLIRKFGKESDRVDRWYNSGNWFWRWNSF